MNQKSTSSGHSRHHWVQRDCLPLWNTSYSFVWIVCTVTATQDDCHTSSLAMFLRYSQDSLLDSCGEKRVAHVAFLGAAVSRRCREPWNAIISVIGNCAFLPSLMPVHGDNSELLRTLEANPQASLSEQSNYSPPESVWLGLCAGRVLSGRYEIQGVAFFHWLTHARYGVCSTGGLDGGQ
jgi:hypothetical protein